MHVRSEPIDLVPTPISELPVAARLEHARVDGLWIHGDVSALEPPLTAIVGTRDADPYGLEMAHAIASGLARRSRVTLSGGALGIDAAAHAGALDAGGRTVVVLPAGLRHLYPMRHGTLYERVVETGGALVSPFPPETPPSRWTFPRRNELVARLCDVIVVVQAPRASGSLLTALAAMKAGRRVLVVPAAADDPRGEGCLRLLRAGASLCRGPEDVLATLAEPHGELFARGAAAALEGDMLETRNSRALRGRCDESEAARSKQKRTSNRARGTRSASHEAAGHQGAGDASSPEPARVALDEPTECVYATLSAAAMHLDEIAGRAAMPASRVRAALMTLVLLGLANERGGGTFSRA